jgi:hypothetical protein
MKEIIIKMQDGIKSSINGSIESMLKLKKMERRGDL